MSFTAVQGNPIVVNLVSQQNDTGWSISGDVAIHASCNAGNIQLIGYTILSGHTYQVSYEILSISGGYLQLFMGTTGGVQRTTTGTFTEELVAAGTNPILYFYSNANCQLKAFNIRDSITVTTNGQKNTVIYSPVIGKWTSFVTMAPDYGLSIFTRTLIAQYGTIYSQANNSDNRNNFFGAQYDSLFNFIANKHPTVISTFQAVAIQGNQLMVTSQDGVQSSLGQLTTLIDSDFEQQALVDNAVRIDIYDRYGCYMASFVQADDGDELKGNWLSVQLQSTDSASPMQIFSAAVKSAVQHIATR